MKFLKNKKIFYRLWRYFILTLKEFYRIYSEHGKLKLTIPIPFIMLSAIRVSCKKPNIDLLEIIKHFDISLLKEVFITTIAVVIASWVCFVFPSYFLLIVYRYYIEDSHLRKHFKEFYEKMNKSKKKIINFLII